MPRQVTFPERIQFQARDGLTIELMAHLRRGESMPDLWRRLADEWLQVHDGPAVRAMEKALHD